MPIAVDLETRTPVHASEWYDTLIIDGCHPAIEGHGFHDGRRGDVPDSLPQHVSIFVACIEENSGFHV